MSDQRFKKPLPRHTDFDNSYSGTLNSIHQVARNTSPAGTLKR